MMIGSDPMNDAIRAAVTRHRLQVEACGLADVPSAVIASAPDLVLLVGDAALGGGRDVLRLLALNPATSVLPVAILTDDASLDDKLSAFRYGAVAVVQRTASADAIGKRVAELARELPERAGEATGELGEATLDEFVELLKKELRSGILSVGKMGKEDEGVRIVLGAGRPVADALNDFVQRLRPLVAEAEPLQYELLEESGGRLQLLEPSGLFELPKADPSILSGTRILVMDSDPGRADALAQELRGHAAKVAVTEVSERGLEKARGLEPEVLIIDGADLDGPAFKLVRGLRRDPRLRWTSMLIVSWAELWPHEDGGPDLPLLAAKIEPLISQDQELVSRCEREEQFDTRLETTGPGRMVRAIAKAKKTIHVTVVSQKATIELDLSQGLVVGAQGKLADGTEIAGTTAVATLLVLSSGRVRIERRMNPSTANVMTPVDECIAAAWLEGAPIQPSIPPSAPPVPPKTQGFVPKAPSPPKPVAPPGVKKKGVEKITVPGDPTAPTPAAGIDRQVARTLMGMPSATPPQGAKPPVPATPPKPSSPLSPLGAVPDTPHDRLTPKLNEEPAVAPEDEPIQTTDPNLTPTTNGDDVAAMMGDLAHFDHDTQLTAATVRPPGYEEGVAAGEERADPTVIDPPASDRPGFPAISELEATEHVPKKKGGAGKIVALFLFLVVLVAGGAVAAFFFVPGVPEALGMGAVTSDQGGDGDGSGPIAEGPDSPPVAAADATAEADAATETEGETAADAATETAADAATETAADAATETDAGAESEGEAEGETETEIAEIDPDRSVDSLVREAESLIRNDEVLAAEPLLDRAYELDPRDNHVLAGLARVYIARGDGPRAVEMAEAAVRRRSRRTSYKLLLGQAYEAAGDIENARATYNRVLRDEPRNPFARRRLEGLGE
jgi:DNA-binding response OmpR family regulator